LNAINWLTFEESRFEWSEENPRAVLEVDLKSTLSVEFENDLMWNMILESLVVTLHECNSFDELVLHVNDHEPFEYSPPTGHFVHLAEDRDDYPKLVVSDVSAKGLTYHFQNDTELKVEHGCEFWLFVQSQNDEDTWHRLNLGMFFTQFLHHVSPHSQTPPREIDFEQIFGELPPGNYRFMKRLTPNVGDLMYEFTIE
jgi:hypothetical protein